MQSEAIVPPSSQDLRLMRSQSEGQSEAINCTSFFPRSPPDEIAIRGAIRGNQLYLLLPKISA